MKKKIFIMLGALILGIASCKKEEKITDTQTAAGTAKTDALISTAKLLMPPGTVLYKATETELREQKAKNLRQLTARLSGKGNNESWPSYQCALLYDSYTSLKSVIVTDGSILCGGPATVEVTYSWTVTERTGQISPNYTFTVQPFLGNTYNGTAVMVSGPTGLNCHPDWGCLYTQYEYDVTVVMDYPNFAAANTTNTVTGTHSKSGPCKAEPPVSLSHTGSLDFPCSYYTTIQPAVNVFSGPGAGQVSVYDICNVCPNGAPPHTLCPNTLSFEYKLIGTSTWNGPFTITGAGTLSGLSAGNYDYRCTANYSCGSSLPRTGTFTVF